MEAKNGNYTSGEKALSEKGVNKLLSVITDLKHLILLKLAISTGIRREDIVKVKVADINIEDRSVKFHESKKNRIHTVYVSQQMITSIEMLIKANPKAEYLFPSNRGKHLSGRTAYNILQMYLDKAELKNRPFHTLRATCMKLCKSRGWSDEEVSKLTGDTIRTVQMHYTTPSEEEMKDTAKDKAIL